MAESLDIPPPEITAEEFERSWTRFELVAAAKAWSAEKQLAVVPTLLRGKLLDYYVELEAAETGDLPTLKGALSQRAGLKKDSLVAAKSFVERTQHSQEKATDFAAELKKLFKQAYPEESLTSAVLLRRFVTGLRPTVGRQLLLQGKPESLEGAITAAADIEYAFGFADTRGTDEDGRVKCEVNALRTGVDTKVEQLQQALEIMTKRFEALESQLKDRQRPQQAPAYQARPPRGRRRQGRPERKCFACGEEGHFWRQCPLNYHEPARKVGDSWQSKY